MKNITILIILLIFCSVSLLAQTPAASPKQIDIGITATLALGDVTAMNAESKTLTLKTKDGDIVVTLSDATQYQKASVENPADLKLATPAALTDISVGDRVIASGKIAEDKKSMVSRRVILMTKGDITKIHQADSEAWAKGINGKVTAVNPINKEITVTMRGMMGERSVIIGDTSKTKFRRYSSNSVKYSDAQPGSYEEVKTGDQLRARGTRSEDGAKFSADEIISGTFRTAGGVITAIDTVKNEITINDVITKKPVTISLNESTTLKKFPLEMAQGYVRMQMMAAMGGGQMIQGGAGGQGGQRPATPGGQTTTGTAPQGSGTPQGTTGTAGTGGAPAANGQGGQGQGQGRPGGGMGMRPGNLDDILERLPLITLADLKVGEAIAVSSTPGQDPGRLSAFRLLAGVEPFLNAPAISMPQGAGRQSSPSINIPGLDGIGSP